MKKQIPELQPIGYISRAHGVHGEINIITDQTFGDELLETEFLFIELQGKPVPFPVEYMRWQSENMLLAKVEFIEGESQARSMKGKKIWVEKLPEFISEVSTIQQYVGYEIVNESGSGGKVTSVLEIPGNPILITIIDENEILIPLEADYILDIDTKTNLIRVNLPEGLTDI